MAAYGARKGQIVASYYDQMEQQADGEYTADLKTRSTQVAYRVVAHIATGEGIERHSTDHTRYSDAAAMFWQTVQLMPDDGKDVPTFPGWMRREGPDRVNGGIWSVELEVVR